MGLKPELCPGPVGEPFGFGLESSSHVAIPAARSSVPGRRLGHKCVLHLLEQRGQLPRSSGVKVEAALRCTRTPPSVAARVAYNSRTSAAIFSAALSVRLGSRARWYAMTSGVFSRTDLRRLKEPLWRQAEPGDDPTEVG